MLITLARRFRIVSSFNYLLQDGMRILLKKSMCCGVVTLYHDNFNYGGLLQAFALQRVITSLGHRAELITFDNVSASYYQRRLRHFTLRQSADAILRKVRSFASGKEKRKAIQKRRATFRQFEAVIPHSELVSSREFPTVGSNYDVLIVGSDQVWNPAWWNNILLLRGVDGSTTKKVSYAASMGCSSLNPTDAAELKAALKDFSAISMREPSGIRLVEEVTGGASKAAVTLDPTLLLSRGEWLEAIPKQKSHRVPDKPFALLYLVDKFHRYTDASIRFCVSAGLQCVVVSYSMEMVSEIDGATYLYDCTPQEWIHLINEASLVITDSFHGIAFAANFNKPFWCFRKTETLNGSNIDDRQEALLSRFGLAYRIVDADSILDLDSRCDAIDFELCNRQLEIERIESIEFLKNNICSDWN